MNHEWIEYDFIPKAETNRISSYSKVVGFEIFVVVFRIKAHAHILYLKKKKPMLINGLALRT